MNKTIEKNSCYTIEVIENKSVQSHSHFYMQILVVTSGAVLLTVNEESFILSSDCMTVIKSYQPHSISNKYGSFSAICFKFMPQYLNHFNEMLRCKKFGNASVHLNPLTASYAVLESEKHYEHNITDIKPLLYVLFSEFVQNNFLLDSIVSEKNSVIHQILTYIEENFDKPISLESAAEILHINKSYLCRCIKEKLDTSFLEILHNYRINHAVYILNETSKNITEAAFDSGFNSIRTFNRIFKNYLGITPGEFRQKN